MKKLSTIFSALLIAVVLAVSAGCYVIKGQRMKDVKGTYELTRYTRTNGKTNEVTDYLTTYDYKVYLVVTGEQQGYCIFSDHDTPAYYYACTLSYVYDEEDTDIIEYVSFTHNGKVQKFGVTKNGLNFSRPAIKISDKMAQDGYDLKWKQVSDDTDLSYVEEIFGSLS